MVFDWVRRKKSKYSPAGIDEEVNKVLSYAARQTRRSIKGTRRAKQRYLERISEIDPRTLTPEQVKNIQALAYLFSIMEEDDLEYLEQIKEIAEY